jgi:hypothetical protein
MYPGKVNSPATTLSEGFTSGDNHIHVTELGNFPTAPNIAVIGSGTDAVTYLYTGKSAATGSGTLTGVSDIEGTDKNWNSGEIIARNFTCYDNDTFIDNITAAPNNVYRNAITNSNFDVWQRLGTKIETTHRARSSNVATLTTSANHNLSVGDHVVIFGIGGSGYNSVSVTVVSTPSDTTFTYSNTGSNEGTTADTGGDIYSYDHPVFINPDFEHTADRWEAGIWYDGTPPNELHGYRRLDVEEIPGSTKCYRIEWDGVGGTIGEDGAWCAITQRIPGLVPILAGQDSITFSLVARSNVTNKKITASVILVTNDWNEYVSILDGEPIELTSSFTKHTLTADIPSCSSLDSTDTNSFLYVEITHVDSDSTGVGYGSAGYIEYAQIQICLGDVALDYCPPDPIQEELLCKADYERIGRRGIYAEYISPGVMLTTTLFNGIIRYFPKRNNPTIAMTGDIQLIYEGPAAQTINSGASSINYPTINSAILSLTVDYAITLGHAVICRLDTSAAGYFEIYTGW